ncbi:hypothetical protein [Streptomyces cucumeris]|uniref:hypothetical protein n=1 Tax=Streptomyces cucumeris TaxID=2962890 RepID=UPI0020C89C05|nr:hypothetical protein [Streptomyces sp. NEAU-Y11]MCP9209607.1 hypothetical protein [Streptomyces sp. NEAU-Y11]
MGDAYKEAPKYVPRIRAVGKLIFRQRVINALEEGGVPEAERGEKGPVCLRAGYYLLPREADRGKVVNIVILGRSSVPVGIRQGERDAVTQQARAALVEAGIEVRIDQHGHLEAVDR